MKPHLTDTHCHLTLSAYAEDQGQVIARAKSAGVTRIVVPGIDLATSDLAVQLAERTPGVYAAVGIHPHDAEEWSPQARNQLRTLAGSEQVIAIGEIGLDFYRNLAPAEKQRQALRGQLRLAAELDLPVIVHNREATGELIEHLIEWAGSLTDRLRGRAGVLHAFSADRASAAQAIAAGFFIGIAGSITFKNAHARREITQALPLASLLLETDSPYLTPHPHRGRRNEPANLPLIASQLAAITQANDGHIASVTSDNAARLFGWENGNRDNRLH